MDRITKALQRLTSKERKLFKDILLQIKTGNIFLFDIKKLKGRDDIYRVRKGNMRIIFRKIKDSVKILALEHRSSKTYRARL
ncbi:MAG: hypothetical protein AAB525_01940 [Patescibacteria group bacterium]